MQRGESTVSWLRRSTKTIAHQSRQLLNDWLQPLDDDTDLLQRIIGDNAAFRGAFLEVYLNACFRQAGWNFQRSPEVVGPTGRPEVPDFVVHSESSSCYFEAATTNPRSDKPGSQQRLDRLLNKINDMASPNFSLMVDVDTDNVGPDDPPAGPLERELQAWLGTLDPDAEPNFDNPPTHIYSMGGWRITFEAIAISPQYRGLKGNVIASQFEGGAVTDDEPLTRALKGKAKKYRGLETAYVIAVDENSWEHSAGGEGIELMAWHRTNSLFGASAVITSGPRAGQHARHANGFWRRPDRYGNTRVSAVLLTDHLAPHNALSAVPELWINPAATYGQVPWLPFWRIVRFGWVENQEQHQVFGPATTAAEFWSGPQPGS